MMPFFGLDSLYVSDDEILQDLLMGNSSYIDRVLEDLFENDPQRTEILNQRIAALPFQEAKAVYEALSRRGHILPGMYYPLMFNLYLATGLKNTAAFIFQKVIPKLTRPFRSLSGGFETVFGLFVHDALSPAKYLVLLAGLLIIPSLQWWAILPAIPALMITVYALYVFSLFSAAEVNQIALEKTIDDVKTHVDLRKTHKTKLSYLLRANLFINKRILRGILNYISLETLTNINQWNAIIRSYAMTSFLFIPALWPIATPFLALQFSGTILMWHMTVQKMVNLSLSVYDARRDSQLNNEFAVTSENVSDLKIKVGNKQQSFDNILNETIAKLTEAKNKASFTIAYRVLHNFQGRMLTIHPQLTENPIVASINQCISNDSLLELAPEVPFAKQPKLDNEQITVVANLIETLQRIKMNIATVQIDTSTDSSSNHRAWNYLTYSFRRITGWKETARSVENPAPNHLAILRIQN